MVERQLVLLVAAEQLEGRPIVELDVMERVGEDLGRPDEAGLHVLDEEELDGAEHQPGATEKEPYQADTPEELRGRRARPEEAETGGVEQEYQRRQRPDGQEDDLAPEIVADLDLFLVLMRRLVDLVVALGLEEEMADLPARHRQRPADQRRHRRMPVAERVRAKEAAGAQQMKR